MKIFSKKLKKFGLITGFLVSLLVSGSVFAATQAPIPAGDTTQISQGLAGVDLFTPSVNDKSISYLGQLFGSVGNVLHGTSGQLFEKMFEILNVGVLVIAILFFTFNMTKWFVETGTHGQFMNQKGGGLFMFIRSIMGIGILVPKAGGYSIIQIIVMWMVIQGVGLADKTWSTALDYLNSDSGTVYNSPAVITEPLLERTNQVLAAQVCMIKSHQLIQEREAKFQRAENGGIMPTGIRGRLNSTANSIPAFKAEYNANTQTFYFPGSTSFNKDNPPSNDEGLCGAFKIADSTDDENLAVKKEAFIKLYEALQPEAAQIADWPNFEKDLRSSPNFKEEDLQQATRDQEKQVISHIFGAASNYLNAMSTLTLQKKPISRGILPSYSDTMLAQLNAQLKEKRQEIFEQAKGEGWIMAGRYYHMLSIAQSEAKEGFLDKLLPSVKGSDWSLLGTNNHDLTQITSPQQRNLFANQEDAKDLASAIGQSLRYSAEAKKMLAERNTLGDTTQIGQDFRRQGGSMLKNDPFTYMISILNPAAGPAIMAELSQLKDKVASMMEGKNNNNPIIGIKDLGQELLTFVSVVWLAGSIAALAIGLIVGICQASNPAATAFTLAYQWLIPLLMTMLAVFAAIGVVLYAYVPLIPFILFTFAAIGWFISVVEAMVAGPLVAFGMTHPEGHDFLGKAEQAGMLLLGVFLKPTLMLMGLLGGMILSRVALQLVNHGFYYLLNDLNVMQTGQAQWGGFLKLGAVIVVYAFLAVAIVKQAFSMIYIIPEKVMRWIGMSPDYTQMPKEVMDGGQGMVSSYGSQGGGFASKGQEALGGLAQNIRGQKEKKENKKQQDPDGNNASAS